MGVTATLLGAAMGPIVGVGGASARRGTGKEGLLGLRIAGWIGYGLFLTNAAVLIGEGVANIKPFDGAITATGLLGSFSLVALSADALASCNLPPVTPSPASRQTSSTAHWTWVAAPVAEHNGKIGGAVGLIGSF